MKTINFTKKEGVEIINAIGQKAGLKEIKNLSLRRGNYPYYWTN